MEYFRISESLKKFGKAKNKEAVIMGIDKSSEYIAADSLDRPSNLEPVIVTPALLAPGHPRCRGSHHRGHQLQPLCRAAQQDRP